MWNIILGEARYISDKMDLKLVTLTKEKRLESSDANPQQFYPGALDKFRKEMKENG